MPWYIRVPSASNVALSARLQVFDDVSCETMLAMMLKVLTQSEMDGGGTGA